MLTYTLPADLVQAIVEVLNEIPAVKSRRVLNGIERFCLEQEVAAGTAELKDQPADAP